jgi:hypothetical protein
MSPAGTFPELFAEVDLLLRVLLKFSFLNVLLSVVFDFDEKEASGEGAIFLGLMLVFERTGFSLVVSCESNNGI